MTEMSGEWVSYCEINHKVEYKKREKLFYLIIDSFSPLPLCKLF